MRQRAAAMVDRVAAEARACLTDTETHAVITALTSSLAHRGVRVPDDHDSRSLHPARTLRILIADAACRSAPALIAASHLDTFDPDLVPPFSAEALIEADRKASCDTELNDRLRYGLFRDSAAVLAGTPLPRDDASETLEALVTAPAECAVIALAERLDQVRHLHLRRDRPWDGALNEVRAACIPAARRVVPQLARRFERWADAFERRLLLRRRADLP